MTRRLIDALTNDLLLKLTAIGLAFLLWTTVTTPDPVAIDGIPVQVVVRDVAWALRGDADPATVTVDFTGPLRQLVRVATERPPIVLTVDQVADTIQTFQLRSTALALTPDMGDTRIEAIRPLTVTLRFDRITNRSVPIAIGIIGAPLAGFELAGPVTVEPSSVRATGPGHLLDQVDTLRLDPIDLSRRTGFDTVTMLIENLPRDVTVDPTSVRVILPLRRIPADTIEGPNASDEPRISAGDGDAEAGR